MKTTFAIFSLCLTLLLPLTGCKKSGESGAQSGGPAAGGSRRPDEAARLQIKWPVGNRYVERMELKQNSEMVMPQMPQPMKQELTMGEEYALSVLQERAGGGRELEMEFLAIQMNMSAGGQPPMAFDSKGAAIDEESNPLAGALRKMIGSRLKLLTDASNQVEEIEGFNEFFAKVSVGLPPQVQGMMSGMLSEDQLKQMAGQGLSHMLPDKPVKPGDSWPVNFDLSGGPIGTINLDLNYSFKRWEDHEKRNCALLDFGGTMTSKDGQTAGPMGVKVVIENGSMSGKTWFDPDLGMAVGSDIDQVMKLLITFPQPQGAAANPGVTGGSMTNQLVQKITVKLLELTQSKK